MFFVVSYINFGCFFMVFLQPGPKLFGCFKNNHLGNILRIWPLRIYFIRQNIFSLFVFTKNIYRFNGIYIEQSIEMGI